ncbi:MAG: VanZ family protein [Armatimonadota bacterium]|nr:VanZ family protein [Armatimonadota bacterium]
MRPAPWRWVPVVLWTAGITAGSLLPGIGAPSGPDVLLHGGAYLGLAWLIRSALAGRSRQDWWHAVLPAVAYGILMEGLQSTLGYRGAQLHDVMANAAGALAGALLPPIRWPVRREGR